MMIVCAECGACDELDKMYSDTNADGESVFVCESCASGRADAVAVSEVSASLGGFDRRRQ